MENKNKIKPDNRPDVKGYNDISEAMAEDLEMAAKV